MGEKIETNIAETVYRGKTNNGEWIKLKEGLITNKITDKRYGIHYRNAV